MSKHVVILASINTDITASAVRLPERGETVEGYSVDMFGGGKGANQAIQCAKLGLDTHVIGMVGDDMQGNFVRQSLTEKGVNIDKVKVSSEYRTGCAAINVDPNGDNTLVYAPGANHHIAVEQLEECPAFVSPETILNPSIPILEAEDVDSVMYSVLRHRIINSVLPLTILFPSTESIPSRMPAMPRHIVPSPHI